MFTNSEMLELRQYIRNNPIDDQSNHHLPIAYLQSTVQNIMGGKTKMADYLLFREINEYAEVDAQLLSGYW